MGESGWKRIQCLKMDNIFFRCFAFLPICIASSIYANIRPKSQWHQRATHIGADPSPLEAHFEIWVNANNFLYLCHPPIQGKIVDLQEYDSKNIVGELYQVAVDHRRLVEVISCHLFGVEMIHVDIDGEFSTWHFAAHLPWQVFCSRRKVSVPQSDSLWQSSGILKPSRRSSWGGVSLSGHTAWLWFVKWSVSSDTDWQMNKLAKLGYALAISNLKLSVTLSLDRGNC